MSVRGSLFTPRAVRNLAHARTDASMTRSAGSAAPWLRTQAPTSWRIVKSPSPGKVIDPRDRRPQPAGMTAEEDLGSDHHRPWVHRLIGSRLLEHMLHPPQRHRIHDRAEIAPSLAESIPNLTAHRRRLARHDPHRLELAQPSS